MEKEGPKCSSFALHKPLAELQGGRGTAESGVMCPQSAELGLSRVTLDATAGLTPAHSRGGCTGLGSPHAQTGDRQSSWHEDSTA